jgi:hypothetical protein
MSLYHKIRVWYNGKGREQSAIDDVLEHNAAESLTLPPPKSPGKIIKATKKAEFSNPHGSYQGGQVIRVMPKTLQKIVEAQEPPGEH